MKKLVIGIGSVLGLFLILFVALEFLLDLNSYKGHITSPLETTLRRQVTIGNIDHTFWRGPGASVQDVTIFDREQGDSFVTVKEIVAKIKLLPLLSKKLDVAKILLDQPVVVVKRDAEGSWNVSDLLGQPAAASPLAPQTKVKEAAARTPEAAAPAETQEPSATTSAPPSAPATSPLAQLAIDRFQLDDGTVRIIDERANVTTELSQIRGDVQGIALESPIQFQVSANVDSGAEGSITASGQVGPLPADGTLHDLPLDVTANLEQIKLAHFRPYYQQVAQARDAQLSDERINATVQVAGNLSKQLTSTGNVSVGEVEVEVSGNVQHANTVPELDLTLSSRQLSWEKLIQLLPPELAEQVSALGLSGQGTIHIRPKGTLDNLVIAGEFDLSESGLRYQELFAKPEALATTLAFEAALKPDSLTLSSLELTLGDLRLTLTGTLSNFQAPVLDIDLSSNEFSLDKLFQLFPQFKTMASEEALVIQGPGRLEASATGPLDNLALRAKVDLTKSTLTYPELFDKPAMTPGTLALEAQLGQDSVAVESLSLQLGAFQATAAGGVSNFANPELDVTLETNLFDIEALFAQFPVVKEKYLPKEFVFSGNGKLRVTSTGPLDRLTLAGALDLTQGAIQLGQYFQKPKDIPGVVEFDTTLTKGAVEIRRVHLNINEVLFDITGVISGLQQDAMLDLEVTSNRFALNQILPVEGMVVNPSGTAELALTLAGPADEIDVTSIVAGTLRLTDSNMQIPDLAVPVRNLNALCELQDQTLTVSQFSARLGESSLQGTATVAKLFTAPAITFMLDSPVLNLDELLEAGAQARFPAAAAFQLAASTQTVPIPASKSPPAESAEGMLPAGLTAAGQVKIGQGQVKQVHFADLTADVIVEKQVVTIDNLLFQLYDGTYQGNALVDLSSPEPAYQFHSELVNVDSNRLLADSASLTDVLYGLAFANASLQGQGSSSEQIVRTLAGSGTLKIEEGKFTTFDVWSQLASIFELLGSVGQSKTLSRIGEDFGRFPQETHFSRFEGSFVLKNGSAGSSDMLLEIPEQDMHITLLLEGEFGLDTSLDFVGKIRFSPQSKYYDDMKKPFRDFRQGDGSIVLPFPIPIGGTLLEPEIDMRSAQKSLTTFAKELAKQAAKSQLEKAGKNLLKELFK